MISKKISFLAGVETIIGEYSWSEGVEGSASVLSLHGAGPSSRDRMLYVVDYLADKKKKSSFRFDFSGHGESSGSMTTSSLDKRTSEAVESLKFISIDKPLVLFGTSMGAHIACSLLEYVHVSHLILFCPAAYASAAESVQFGPNFSRIIRAPLSYLDSMAFKKLENFKGRFSVIIGSNDTIIPLDVVEAYLSSAKCATSKRLEIIDGAPHQIHGYAEKNKEIKDRILKIIGGELDL